jgi:hypothetical protein
LIAVTANPAWHFAFDALAWVAAGLAGVAVHRWRLKGVAERIAASTGPRYFLALGLGAVLGAWGLGSANTLLGPVPSLSHSIAGALAGAIIGVELYKALTGLRGSTGAIFVVPFTVGVVAGRWGCLMAGLADGTYGVASSVPWAVDLGDGIGRHPVQIYESLAMLGFLIVYLMALARRADWAMRRGFYVMVGVYAVQRFFWEFLKPYPTLFGPFNLFHLLMLGLITYAVVWYRADLARQGRNRGGAQGGALDLLWPDDEPVRELPATGAGENPR